MTAADLKLGRRAPKNAPALKLADILTGVTPAHPAIVDHFGRLPFGLYENDRFGVCGPCAAANLVRLVSAGLTGSMVQPTQADVFDLYRRSGNPNFNPITSADDNGVDMQTMLEALLADGIGASKPVAFAKVDVGSDAELAAAESIFGGVLWGVNLETAQHAQTDARPPVWDYRAPHTPWGGHAIMAGKFNEPAGNFEVISWELDVQTTRLFRAHQLEEAWVVAWPWNLEHPAFQAGIDAAALASAYQALTGRPLVIPPSPTLTPAPPSPAPPDRVLWAATEAWSSGHHTGLSITVAHALQAWAQAKGLQ